MFSLPISLGGLGICNHYSPSGKNYKFSYELSCPLVNLIFQQCDSLPHNVIDLQCFILKHLSQAKHQSQVDITESVLAYSPVSLRQTLEYCKEKRASSWLSAIPIEQHRFALHKTDLTDALCLHYGWSLSHLPSHCVCGKAFSVSHAFSCLHGAFPILRHNDVQDLTAKLMSEVCHDIQAEPHLQLFSGESLHYKSAVHKDDSRVDIRAAGFWNCHHHCSFFDVRVFNAFAESNLSSCPAATFQRHEGKKT